MMEALKDRSGLMVKISLARLWSSTAEDDYVLTHIGIPRKAYIEAWGYLQPESLYSVNWVREH